MTSNRTAQVVARQQKAMGCIAFEIGIRHPRKGMMIRQWDGPQTQAAVDWLRHKNASGCDIYVRPALSLGVILLDDLSRDAVKRMVDEGLEPAVVIETSPGNHQCWVRLIHNRECKPIDSRLIHNLCLELADEYHADKNSTDWRHFGRLAGFTNRKPQYAKNGLQPFVLLRQASGKVASEGRSRLLKLREKTRKTAESQEKPAVEKLTEITAPEDDGYLSRLRRLFSINRTKPWVTNPDWSRIDFMIARDMLMAGHNSDVVGDTIRRDSPNLEARKGRNVEAYLLRTINAAQSFIPPPTTAG